MNRLVIIGNGLDLAINMKTSYKQFICGFFEKIDITYKQYHQFGHRLVELGKNGVPGRRLYLDNPVKYASNFLEIKSPLLEETLKDIDEKGWTDIEQNYYNILLNIYNGNKPYNKSNPEEEVSNLNTDLESIKSELAEYLATQLKKAKPNNSALISSFCFPFLSEDFDDATLNQEELKIQIDDKNSPNEVCVLNFNYTNIIKDSYSDKKYYNTEKCFPINIHGSLDDVSSMVFGYGDEYDRNYQNIEALNKNEWLKGFKSFSYLRSKQYDRLLGFLEKEEFQVFIVGHSCGLSDKTLLKEIFEHKHCLNIKVFYYEKKNDAGNTVYDDFDDTCFNISRIFTDKPKLRKVVTKKSDWCKFEHII
jgi:hypothetical protein